ncbi:DUF4124 domain-containing protein [Gilvimarinus sp. DA14]|uniref:DUF4124 domain-containing protein n=1 Tax=Gilvimarinus sp. DA14 TaxID=2956798 RepID=UPI0020B64141|nr:DUF4124 domain-containing protein [Gilvimarinus sp. DA14]UTF58676.1 DUF4124 domain-containing protein [Gilvimarinus sp. DA14]
MMRLCLLFLIFITLPAAAQLYQWTDEDGRTHYSDKPPPGQQVEAPGASSVPAKREPQPMPAESQPANLDNVTYSRPAYSEAFYLRHLLRTGQYDQLNRELEFRQQAVERDNTQDIALRSVYSTFASAENKMLNEINRWVNATPDNYQPYLARARCRGVRGWAERGGAYAHRTPRDNFSRMQREFAFAHDDLKKALAINPRALMAFVIQISLAQPIADRVAANRALQEANRMYPDNYIVRRAYIRLLVPRWGGSWNEIETFVSRQPLDTSANPKLKQLAGFEDYERGLEHYRSKDYDLAIESFNKSLTTGPNSATLYQRGRAHYWLRKYRLAIDDFNGAIHLQPDIDYFHYWRAKAFYYFGSYSNALADIERAYALNSADEDTTEFREKIFRNYNHPELSDADNNLARQMVEKEVAKYDEQNQFKQSLAYLVLGENESAEAVLRRLTQLKPENMKYARWLDFALFRQARLSDIVAFWDGVIARYPDNAVAYSERAGTYYHLEQYYRALDSARMAEKLGDPEAPEFVQRLVALTTRPEPRLASQ